jgi:hypothetical protein
VSDEEELSVQQLRAAGAVWTLGDDAGLHAVPVADGRGAVRFWSSANRAARARRTDPASGRLAVVRLELPVWTGTWLPGLAADGLLVVLDGLPPREPGSVLAQLQD